MFVSSVHIDLIPSLANHTFRIIRKKFSTESEYKNKNIKRVSSTSNLN